MFLTAALFLFSQAPSPATVGELLSRVAEEAEILQQNIPRAVSTETLEERTLLPANRFRPRIGKNAVRQAPQPRLQVRRIVSEYSVGMLKESDTPTLCEFRQVISVDGRKVQTVESARHALSLGLKSADDRARKRMLEDFAGHGLVDVATDYGLILLSFSKRGQRDMEITLLGEEEAGGEPALALAWQQTSNAAGMLEFIGNQAARRAMRGRLLVRRDGLPVRVQVWTEHPLNGHQIRDEGTVDYAVSVHGFLTPTSVAHRHLVDGQVITENLYTYEAFKLFSADIDIKFTELDTPPAAKK